MEATKRLTFMKNKKGLESDYNITFFKTCERLQKNKRTISCYIRKDLITPEKGAQGAQEVSSQHLT